MTTWRSLGLKGYQIAETLSGQSPIIAWPFHSPTHSLTIATVVNVDVDESVYDSFVQYFEFYF